MLRLTPVCCLVDYRGCPVVRIACVLTCIARWLHEQPAEVGLRQSTRPGLTWEVAIRPVRRGSEILLWEEGYTRHYVDVHNAHDVRHFAALQRHKC